MAPLGMDFFDRDTLTVARELLGCYLVRQDGGERMVGRITETEAYIGAIDKACHAYGGRRSPRTETLYAAPGTAYVYLVYGLHCCLNLVTEGEGTAAAVLIRGCEPVLGLEQIARRRFGLSPEEMSPRQRRELMNGPGKLCKGLSIDRSCNGLPCGSSALYVTAQLPELGLAARPKDLPFHTGKRIGIDYAEEAIDFPWRFWLA